MASSRPCTRSRGPSCATPLPAPRAAASRATRSCPRDTPPRRYRRRTPRPGAPRWARRRRNTSPPSRWRDWPDCRTHSPSHWCTALRSAPTRSCRRCRTGLRAAVRSGMHRRRSGRWLRRGRASRRRSWKSAHRPAVRTHAPTPASATAAPPLPAWPARSRRESA